jgi:hypothetical protein
MENVSFSSVVMVFLVATLLFGFIALVMLTVNDHGQENTSCIKNTQCIKVLNGVIITLVFATFIIISPYVLPMFLSKNVSLVLNILFTILMLIGSSIAVGILVHVGSASDQSDNQTNAMQAMTYMMGLFGLLASCSKLLQLGSAVEKLFTR